MAEGAGAQTFSSTRVRRARAVTCVVVAALAVLLLAQMASTPTSLVEVYMVIVALFALAMLVCAARSLQTGMTLDEEGVTVRGILSTRRWRWEEIRSAETRDRTAHRSSLVGITPRSPEPRTQVLPSLHLADGTTVPLHSMRLVVASDASVNWVDDAINELNRRLKARRGPDGPAAGPGSR